MSSYNLQLTCTRWPLKSVWQLAYVKTSDCVNIHRIRSPRYKSQLRPETFRFSSWEQISSCREQFRTPNLGSCSELLLKFIVIKGTCLLHLQLARAHILQPCTNGSSGCLPHIVMATCSKLKNIMHTHTYIQLHRFKRYLFSFWTNHTRTTRITF